MKKNGQEETDLPQEASDGEEVFASKTDIEECRTKALERVLETFRREYEEQAKIFSVLDQKAQATTALAGVFLAAVLAFVKVEELERLFALLGGPGFWILSILISALIAVVVLGLYGTSLKDCPLPPKPEDLLQAMEDVLDYPAAQRVHFANLLTQEIALWKPIVEDYLRVNEEKSRVIFNAQFVLSLAIIGVALLLLILVLVIYSQKPAKITAGGI